MIEKLIEPFIQHSLKTTKCLKLAFIEIEKLKDRINYLEIDQLRIAKKCKERESKINRKLAGKNENQK